VGAVTRSLENISVLSGVQYFLPRLHGLELGCSQLVVQEEVVLLPSRDIWAYFKGLEGSQGSLEGSLEIAYPVAIGVQPHLVHLVPEESEAVLLEIPW
jgi:intein/homing endonuclease